MNILALDAAYGQASACLLAKGRLHYEMTEDPMPHSQAVIPMLSRLLAAAGIEWEQLDVIGLGIGPGAFTGIRIASATVASLNVVLNKPVLGVSSLAVTARQTDEPGTIWVLEDARAGEMFAGCYDNGFAVIPDSCHSYAELSDWPIARYAAHRPPPGCSAWTRAGLRLDRGVALAEVIQNQLDGMTDIQALPHFVTPVYLQRSQAERNATNG